MIIHSCALIRGIAAQEPDLRVVGEAEDGTEAIPLTHELRPNIILLDLIMIMPRVNGLEALGPIKAKQPETKVIIVTVHTEDAYRRAAGDGGVDAFLVKKTLMTALLPTIRRMRGATSPPEAPSGIARPGRGQGLPQGPSRSTGERVCRSESSWLMIRRLCAKGCASCWSRRGWPPGADSPLSGRPLQVSSTPALQEFSPLISRIYPMARRPCGSPTSNVLTWRSWISPCHT